MNQAGLSALVARQANYVRQSAWARFPLTQARWEAIAIFALCPTLLSAAMWNGFPLIFYDTGAYMLQSFGHKFVPERSPVFSLFILFAGGRVSLWLVAALQSLMTSFVMVQMARALAPRMGLLMLLGIVAALVLLTGLPWYAGQIEPDIFTSLVVLGTYLLGFHARSFGWWRNALLIAITAVAIACHPSHFGLGAGLVLCLAVFRWVVVFRRRSAWQANLLLPVASLCLGFCLIVAGNYIYTRQVFISRAGPVFMFARMLQDGVVQRLLKETCPGANYTLCRYQGALPHRADKWLWGPGTLFVKLHRFIGTERESARIVHDALVHYPVWNVQLAVRDTLQQLTLFHTGDQIEPQQWILFTDFYKFIPDQLRAYNTARQQRGKIDFGAINYVHVPIGAAVLLLLVVAFVYALRQRDVVALPLLGFILLALLGNAVVCGVFSNPHARYQSRLIWVPAFALALLMVEKRNSSLQPS